MFKVVGTQSTRTYIYIIIYMYTYVISYTLYIYGYKPRQHNKMGDQQIMGLAYDCVRITVYTYTHVHNYIYIEREICLPTYIHAQIYIYTYIHAYIHTHIPHLFFLFLWLSRPCLTPAGGQRRSVTHTILWPTG